MDDLVLIPVDNGYATVNAVEARYIIVDSQSDMPAVLKSYDGSINKAARLSEGSLRQSLKLDPQNGSNYAILDKYADSSGNEYGQFLRDVTLKYKPFYLLVK